MHGERGERAATLATRATVRGCERSERAATGEGLRPRPWRLVEAGEGENEAEGANAPAMPMTESATAALMAALVI